MTILAIDPGPVTSAYVRWDGRLRGFGKVPNSEIIHSVDWLDVVVIEQVRSYGMPVGAEVFDTVHWSGRFHERAVQLDAQVSLVPRKDVKLHLCQSPRANDATIRQALIDKFGGKDAAIGKKATPGPLYGLKADCWQALALAVTWWETRRGDGLHRSDDPAAAGDGRVDCAQSPGERGSVGPARSARGVLEGD